ncbi:hypothetical protein HORIV_27370 [Vreelandella olivaria]|uniref:Uncharacterized protein n=1 Tax=Vreelandella olivaria TaxID=390919 RepID=A0ABM7GI67_9GAMM|nr:hypothetical protein HORIV_27370 [Halomonas olivaria]
MQALAGYLKLSRRPDLLRDPQQLLLLLAQPTPSLPVSICSDSPISWLLPSSGPNEMIPC